MKNTEKAYEINDNYLVIRNSGVFSKLFVGGLSVAVALALLLFFLAFDQAPIVPHGSIPAREYVSVTRNLIHQTVHETPSQGKSKTLNLTAGDLSAVISYYLSRRHVVGDVRCLIEADRLKIDASIPRSFLGGRFFLNVRFVADDEQKQVVIRKLKVGRLRLPSSLFGWGVVRLFKLPRLESYERISEQLVREIRIRDDLLSVRLNWNRDMLANAQGMILDLSDKERLLVYQDKLAEIVSQPGLKRFLRLSQLLQPMFALAKSRSESGSDPIAENRALIVVLSAYINGKNLAAAIPEAQEALHRDVLLNKRIDTAQHFIGSAALTIGGHGAFADMLGLAKEMNDTHHGSGFSFNDLAADRAGVQFGKYAVRSDDDALKIQKILSARSDESLFMPSVKDLPENLDSSQFFGRFSTLDSHEFNVLREKIEGRVVGLPLYN